MARRVWVSPVHRAYLETIASGGLAGIDPNWDSTHIDGRALQALFRKEWVERVGKSASLVRLTATGIAALLRARADEEVTDLLPSLPSSDS